MAPNREKVSARCFGKVPASYVGKVVEVHRLIFASISCGNRPRGIGFAYLAVVRGRFEFLSITLMSGILGILCGGAIIVGAGNTGLVMSICIALSLVIAYVEVGVWAGIVIEGGELAHLRFFFGDQEIAGGMCLVLVRVVSLPIIMLCVLPAVAGVVVGRPVLVVFLLFSILSAMVLVLVFWAALFSSREGRLGGLSRILGVGRYGWSVFVPAGACFSAVMLPLILPSIEKNELGRWVSLLNEQDVLSTLIVVTIFVVSISIAWLFRQQMVSLLVLGGEGLLSRASVIDSGSVLAKIGTLGLAGKPSSIYRFVLAAHLRGDRRFVWLNLSIIMFLGVMLFVLPELTDTSRNECDSVRGCVDLTMFFAVFGFLVTRATSYSVEAGAIWIAYSFGDLDVLQSVAQRSVIRAFIVVPSCCLYSIKSAFVSPSSLLSIVDVVVFWVQLEVLLVYGQLFVGRGLFQIDSRDEDSVRFSSRGLVLALVGVICSVVGVFAIDGIVGLAVASIIMSAAWILGNAVLLKTIQRSVPAALETGLTVT